MSTTSAMKQQQQQQQQQQQRRQRRKQPRRQSPAAPGATFVGRILQLVALLLTLNAKCVRGDVASSLSLSLRRRRKQQQSTSLSSSHSGYHDEITCRLSLYEFIDSQHDPNTKRPAYMCSPVLPNGKVGDKEYEVSTIDDGLQLEHQKTMMEGLETFVTITKCVIDEEGAHVRLTDSSQINLSSYHRTRRRKLADREGTLTALVVRIVMNDKSPIYSKDDLYRVTFQEKVSLRHQYAACSSGKLRVEPSSLGVIEARVNQYSTSSNNKQAVNAATTAALNFVNSQTGESYSSLAEYADMVLFVTPEMGDFLAYASVGGGQSVYNDKWGGFVASHMHETGHNLMLLHAWEVEEYLDYTGYMGGAIVGYHDQVGFPSMCYNAENYWTLGWHDDRKIEVDLYNPSLVKLAAFVDYDKTSAGKEYVIIKAGNIYIHYNRAKGINVDTFEYQDYMVLYQGTSLGSFLFAALHYPDKAQYVRTFPQGDFHAEICNQVSGDGHSTPDYLTVSLGFGDSLCPQDNQSTSSNDSNASTSTSTSATTNATASVKEATSSVSSTTSAAKTKPAPNDDDYYYDDYGQ